MQLEKLDTLNQRLIDYFGIDTVSGKPLWRIVWSDDEYEMRLTSYTNEGFALLTPEVRQLPKYKQWIQHKYLLERLTAVPTISEKEIPGTKISYEPIYVYEDKNGSPLPPKWEVTQFVVDAVLAVQGKGSGFAKYLPGPEDLNDEQGCNLRMQKIYEQLYGNETDITDALAFKHGVTVPGRDN